VKIIELPFSVRAPILACGADLKGALAVAKGRRAYLFDGFGDLAELANYERYAKTARTAIRRLKIKPRVVVCDMHPGYFSSRFCTAYLREGKPKKCARYSIQHHEAHACGAIADSAACGNVFAAVFDGTGYGSDGNIWGGEFFTGNLRRLRRFSHLEYVPMPGGEACIRQPWRMAASFLYSAFGARFPGLKIGFVKHIDAKKWAVLRDMVDKKVNSPLTSSAGRLFDAAAAIILGMRDSRYEAELPIALEKITAGGVDDSYAGSSSLDIIRGIARDIGKRVPAPVISARFHNSVAGLILREAKRAKIANIVLTGGVFQNAYLAARARQVLTRSGFKVFTHSGVSTNDSGIPVGQIAAANARM
jgi:hydrogenase maturation protein HypF